LRDNILKAEITSKREDNYPEEVITKYRDYTVTYNTDTKELEIQDSTYKYIDLYEGEIKQLIKIFKEFGILDESH